MPEGLLPRPEREELLPAVGTPDREPDWAKHPEAAAETVKHDELAASIDKIRAAAQEQAVSTSESTARQAEQASSENQGSGIIGTQQALKRDAYNRTMERTRQRLNAPERSFSKLIHARGVEATSEALGKSLARPSGMLGGAIGALAGTGVLLYMAKYYGFRYNYAFFIACFVAGFGIGLLIETVVKLIRVRS